MRPEVFWSKVRKGEGCWEWTGTIVKSGYGVFSEWDDHRVRQRYAHRRAYELARGPIAKGLCVCHVCDNRKCVRPDHFFLGTKAENTLDRHRKGRTARGPKKNTARIARGQRNGSSVLTDEKVRAMRARFASGQIVADIALEFGVSWQTASNVVHRRGWMHVQ